MCAFVNKNSGEIDKLVLKPKENFVDSRLLKSLESHPGFNERVKLGHLKIIGDTSTPKKEKKVKKDKEVKEVKEDSKNNEDFLQ